MLLSAEHISLNFGLKQLLEDVTLYLNEGDKIGIIGINGTGKSSLLRVLAGQQVPDQGTVSLDPNVQVCFLPQNPAMVEGATVLEQVFLHFPAEFRELNEYEAKAMLTRLGIADFTQPVDTLSGGQRKRVALATVLLHPADVLILDEPTNHLDSEMVAWLEDRLRKFTGGLIMVTHDRYFLDKMAHQIFEVGEGGQVTRYSGNYSDYLDKRQATSAPAQEEKAEKKPAGKPARQKKLKFTFKEQREYDTIEADIAALEARIAQREGEMLPCGSDYGKLQELTKDQQADQAALEEKMERWLYLTDLAERIAAQEG